MTTPSTMRAAVKQNTNEVVIKEVLIPVPRDGEVLVKINAVGVCASDLHLVREAFAYLRMAPGVDIVGHEGCGTVAALGTGCRGIAVGDRVAVKWLSYVCQKCELCKTGYENLCNNRRISGKDLNGCFAEYAIANANYLVRLPDGLDDVAASPILCGGVTVHKALKISNTKKGGWVALPGAAGGLGHLAIQYAKAMGLQVVAIDGGKEKGDLCKTLGADVFLDFTKSKDLVRDVIDATDGGAHCAIVTASSIRAYSDALRYLRKSGALVCIGLPPAGQMIPAEPADFIGRGLRIMGTSTGTLQDTQEALELARRGLVKPMCVEAKLEDVDGLLVQLEKSQIAGRYVVKL